MANEAIPEDVRTFLVEQVRSLMGLEMLLLVQADPGREWTAAEMVRELRSAEEWTEKELNRLAERGLVEAVAGEPRRFRSGAGASGSRPLAWLQRAYPDQRFSIIQAIYAGPAAPLQRFADAFRLRKDRPHG